MLQWCMWEAIYLSKGPITARDRDSECRPKHHTPSEAIPQYRSIYLTTRQCQGTRTSSLDSEDSQPADCRPANRPNYIHTYIAIPPRWMRACLLRQVVLQQVICRTPGSIHYIGRLPRWVICSLADTLIPRY